MGVQPDGMGSDMSASPGLSRTLTSSSSSGSLPLDGSVVKMKGLPFKASIEDVLKFYGGFAISAQSIYLKRHPDGRPSGEVCASLKYRMETSSMPLCSPEKAHSDVSIPVFIVVFYVHIVCM